MPRNRRRTGDPDIDFIDQLDRARRAMDELLALTQGRDRLNEVRRDIQQARRRLYDAAKYTEDIRAEAKARNSSITQLGRATDR